VYPVIKDAKGTVLSLPPIINGEHSKMSVNTKNIFLEVTATDLTKARIVLNTMVTMFAGYCDNKLSVEPVDVVYEKDGRKESSPDLSSFPMEAKCANVRSLIGVDSEELPSLKMVDMCDKMQLDAKYDEADDKIKCMVPPTRSDILHEVDIIEDIAIAYGFNNIKVTIPKTLTVGKQLPINQLSDLLRDEVARAGYMEVLTLGLCGTDENYKNLRRVNDGKAVILDNPATVEFEIVRTSLLPGLLKTLQNNAAIPVKEGVKLFEVSDIVELDEKNDIGATNYRKFAAMYAGLTAGFEVIHGLVDRLMVLLQVGDADAEGDGLKYQIQPAEDDTYFPGRSAAIVVTFPDGTSRKIGSFGVLHPEVLANFEIPYPCSALEMEVELFL
jgi:phenylalanyl-tRNA synthetase beta chain